MKAIGIKLALGAALVLIFLGSTRPSHADEVGAVLTVCNHGTVPVELVAAIRIDNIFGDVWQFSGSTMAPQDCIAVNNHHGTPSYIAFGFTDSKGEWGSGSIAEVPDLGSVQRSILGKQERILTGATNTICAQKDATRYTIDDLSVDCARLKVDSLDLGHGPFLPLASALYFQPETHECDDSYNGQSCELAWTHYYLNIFPSATDRELHAIQVTKSAAAVPEHEEDPMDQSGQILAQVLKAVINAADADSKRRAQAKLDAEEAQLKQAREQQAAREQRDKQILAADAAGNPNVKVQAQMVRREAEDNRQRWAGGPHSPAAYDPKWMGQNVAIVGTVSRVEVDQNGSPQWVTIYFKESPDATFVVCSPYPDLFQEKVGLNLSALVGKTLEAAGQVESPYCGGNTPKGSIRVVESTQWKIH